ncbi:hypothetical protein AX15_006999 [Amanita polypyramis BW_CC]|nr:hypothetical protein AX15_006999 [Amanita polypyramis BW_CC]
MASAPRTQLNEWELRQLYDNEEAERFLRIFSTYVNEVRAPDHPLDDTVPLESDDDPVGTPIGIAEPTYTGNSLSERIATNVIVPLLPPRPSPPPPFTVSHLQLTMQRLYIVLEPAYRPFIVNLINLATWSNKQRSLTYCSIFWTLWWYNMLLPAFFLRILYSLIRRRIFSYPSYIELQEYHQRLDKAAEIGDDLSARLTSTTFGIRDIWKLYKHYVKPAKRSKGMDGSQVTANNVGLDQGTPMPDEAEERRRSIGMKSEILYSLNLIADFHERVKNLFIWRDPVSSRLYGSIILSLFLLSYFIPVQYLSKLAYFCCGLLFWHITPIINALSPGDRARLPPPLTSVPTDIEFAMQIISERVTDGNAPKPSSVRQRPDERSVPSYSTSELVPNKKPNIGSRTQSDDRINWSKWGGRFAMGKTWASQQKHLIAARKMSGETASSSLITEDSYSYPAQLRSTTGLVTITPNLLYFTPAMSTTPTFSIPLQALRSVKKRDMMMKLKGLRIKWMDGTENEVHLVWVGGRDELFVRLVGHEGGRWIKA